MQEDLSLRLKGCKMVRASQRSHGALCTNNIATTAAAAAAESLVGPSVIFLGYGLGNDFRRFGPAPHISSTPRHSYPTRFLLTAAGVPKVCAFASTDDQSRVADSFTLSRVLACH